LYAALALAGRRSGYVIVIVMSLLASGLPAVHMKGRGIVGGGIAESGGGFFFVWTLLTRKGPWRRACKLDRLFCSGVCHYWWDARFRLWPAFMSPPLALRTFPLMATGSPWAKGLWCRGSS
jgi:hypothetical protein